MNDINNRCQFLRCLYLTVSDVILMLYMMELTKGHDRSLRWRHNENDGISNHQPHDCLLKRSSRRRSKKTSKFRVTGLCEGNSPVTGEFPAQRTSNMENASIWWRHHVWSMGHCCDDLRGFTHFQIERNVHQWQKNTLDNSTITTIFHITQNVYHFRKMLWCVPFRLFSCNDTSIQMFFVGIYSRLMHIMMRLISSPSWCIWYLPMPHNMSNDTNIQMLYPPTTSPTLHILAVLWNLLHGCNRQLSPPVCPSMPWIT